MDKVVLPSYLTSLLRVAGGVAGGWLIAKGYFTAEQAAQLGGAGLAIATVIWTLYSKAHARAALKDAIAAPAGDAK